MTPRWVLTVPALAFCAALPLQVVPAEAQQVFPGPFSGGGTLTTDLAKAKDEALVAVGAVLVASGIGAGLGSALIIGGVVGALEMTMSCPVFAGEGTLLGEGSCAWASATGQKTSQFSSNTDSAAWRAGIQKEVGPGWFLGGAAGLGNSWSQTPDGPWGRGQTVDAGVVLKRVTGPFLFAGALGITTTANHGERSVALSNGGAGIMQSDSSVFQGGLRLRGAYDVVLDRWYVRPRVDFDLSYMHQSGFQESGPGLAALIVQGLDKASVAITPTVEVGGRYAFGERLILRPYVALGATFLPDNTLSIDASFAGPLGAPGTFQVAFSGPDVLGNFELGIQLYAASSFDARANYRLSAGDAYLSQSVGLRGAYRF